MELLYSSKRYEKSTEGIEDLLKPHVDKKEFIKSVIEIRNIEMKYIIKYLNDFIIDKYFIRMKTKYGLSINSSEVKKMFTFKKNFTAEELEKVDNEIVGGTFIHTMTFYHPKPNTNVFNLIRLKYKEIENEYFNETFWYDMIVDILEKKDPRLMNYINYLIMIMCLVDAMSTFGDGNLRSIYKDPDKPKLDKVMSEYLTTDFDPHFYTTQLGGYRSFINLMTLNRDGIKYGFRIKRNIMLK